MESSSYSYEELPISLQNGMLHCSLDRLCSGIGKNGYVVTHMCTEGFGKQCRAGSNRALRLDRNFNSQQAAEFGNQLRMMMPEQICTEAAEKIKYLHEMLATTLPYAVAIG